MSDVPLENVPPLVGISAADRLRLAVKNNRMNARMGWPGSAAVAPARPSFQAQPVLLNPTRVDRPATQARLEWQDTPPAAVIDGGAAANEPRTHNRLQGRMLTAQPPMDLFKPPSLLVAHKAKKPKVFKTPEEMRRRLFKQLEITTLGQVLLCVPTSYVDCVNTVDSLLGLREGFKGLFHLKRTGRIEAVDDKKRPVLPAPYASLYEAPYFTHWRNIRMLKVELEDVHGQKLWVNFFSAWRWKNSDPLGYVLIDGTLVNFGSRQVLINTSEPPLDMAGKIWARYNCAGMAKEEEIRQAVLEVLEIPEQFEEAIHSLISTTLLSEKQLIALSKPVIGTPYESLREFFLTLHSPSFTQEGELAAEVARTIAVAGVCNAAKAASMRYPHPKAAINIRDAQVRAAVQSQPEVLTADQVTVVEQLVAALRSPQPLNGLLSGDVGTGKTLAYLIPAVAVHRAGEAVALISPTEILANQLAANLQRRFPDVLVERVMAGGKIRNRLAILVGTSGMGSVARKAGYIPNFLVVDEQHKLATKDRNSMVGPWTHHLEASATPIPRSLASTLFNGTQVFSLNVSPVVRQIESFVLDEVERGQVVGWMRQALDEHQRVAVIYPRVEKPTVKMSDEEASFVDAYALPDDAGGSSTFSSPAALPFLPGLPRAAPVASVTEAAQGLEQRFPGRVGMLHGKLASSEIAATLDDFRSGVKPIVVASTIMETGIDIPDIRLLVVKDAENFGAAQLHQLRGRLARNGGPARFVMMVNDSATLAPETRERLEMVSRTTDGYALAEADMKNRGFGDLAGLAQSGQVSCAFRLLKLTLDDFIISDAESAATEAFDRLDAQAWALEHGEHTECSENSVLVGPKSN